MAPNEPGSRSSLTTKLGGAWDDRARWRGGMVPPVAESTSLSHTTPLPRTDRMPVLLALPMKFSAKHVYLPSSDRLMFLMIKVPSGVTVTLQPGQSRWGHPGDTRGPGKGLGSKENAGEREWLGVGAGGTCCC